MTDIYTVTWPYQPNPRETATFPRYATCLDEDTAKEVQAALDRAYPAATVYAVAVEEFAR